MYNSDARFMDFLLYIAGKCSPLWNVIAFHIIKGTGSVYIHGGQQKPRNNPAPEPNPDL